MSAPQGYRDPRSQPHPNQPPYQQQQQIPPSFQSQQNFNQPPQPQQPQQPPNLDDGMKNMHVSTSLILLQPNYQTHPRVID